MEITLVIFATLLTILIAANILITEAVKTALSKSNIKYSSNLIALISAIVVGGAGSVVAYIFLGIGFTTCSIICIPLFVIAIWVGSMVGFDKIIQFIEQIANIKI